MILDVIKKKSGKPKSFAISREAHADFVRVCKSKPVGRSINDAGTRLVQWFNRQKDYVQTAVTSDVDEGMERHYAAALRKLADELDAAGGKPLHEAAPVIPPGMQLEPAKPADPPPPQQPAPSGKDEGRGKSR